MDSSALRAYLAGVDPVAAPVVVALDDAIRNATTFEVAIKYRILMYSLSGDWRNWICAINATRKGVGLRFLYGVLLDDPLGVLRAGTSILKTWDLGFDDVVDAAAVASYVTEAVGKYDQFKATSSEVLEVSRATAKPRRGTMGA